MILTRQPISPMVLQLYGDGSIALRVEKSLSATPFASRSCGAVGCRQAVSLHRRISRPLLSPNMQVEMIMLFRLHTMQLIYYDAILPGCPDMPITIIRGARL